MTVKGLASEGCLLFALQFQSWSEHFTWGWCLFHQGYFRLQVTVDPEAVKWHGMLGDAVKLHEVAMDYLKKAPAGIEKS